MKIGISSQSYDLNGAFILDIDTDDSDLFSMSRRNNRTETLDGGISMSDHGFSHGDRTITMISQIDDKEIISSLKIFFQTYSNCVLTMRDGVYKAYMSEFKDDFGKVTMIFLLAEVLS